MTAEPMAAGEGPMDRSSRFDAETPSSVRFEQLGKERELRRKAYEAGGGKGAAVLVGTCQEMCPEYERYEREVHMDLSPFEVLPGDPGRIQHQLAVKKYHRPAAGNEAPLPEDVRPGPVLRRTMDYLIGLTERVSASDPGLLQVQKFVRDRSRSIRQDATLQNLRVDADSIAVHQEAARLHVLFGNRLCEAPPADFDAFQNTEQLRKVLQSLQEFYVDARSASRLDLLGDEAEFRAYYLLTHLEDPDVYRKCFSWPQAVLQSPPVQWALGVGAAFHQSDWISFFATALGQGLAALPKRIAYLSACLLASHFPAMRTRAAGVMSKAYAPSTPIPSVKLVAWLAFTDMPELMDWCSAFGFTYDGATDRVILTKTTEDSDDPATPSLKPRCNQRIIERLADGLSIPDIVMNGRSGASVLPAVPIIVPAKPFVPPSPAPVAPPVPAFNLPVVPSSKIDPAFSQPAPVPITLEVVLPPPAAPIEPVITPVAPSAPVVPKPLASAAPKVPEAIVQVMYENLLETVIPNMLRFIAQETTTRHERNNQMSNLIFNALLDDVVLSVAGSVQRSFTLELDELAFDVLEGLQEEVIEETCFAAAIQAQQTAKTVKPAAYDPDPLENAYEAHILRPRPPAKRLQTARLIPLVTPKPVDDLGDRINALKDLLAAERKETARLDSLIQRL